MNDRSRSDELAAVVVAVLLILTALGNAIVMFVVSAICLVAWLLASPRDFLGRGALAETVGCVVAAVIAVVMLLR